MGFWEFTTENLPNSMKNVPVIIVAAMISVVIAALASLYHKYVLGSFIRYLTEQGANRKENAVLLSDTKFSKNVFIKAAVKNGSAYSNVLRAVSCEGIEIEKMSVKERRAYMKKHVADTRYYVPEELKYRAENIFSKKGTNVKGAVIAVILTVIVGVMCLILLPRLFS